MNKVRQFALLTVLAVFGLFAAGYMLLVKPKAAEVGELNETRAAQETSNTQLQGQIKMLQEQAKKLPAVQAELAAIAKQLPANPELPALIRSVTAAADDAGLILDAMSPEPPTIYGAAATDGAAVASTTPVGTAAGSDLLAMVPVEFKIHGGYHNMQLFFANLENLPRTFVLHKFSIKEMKALNKYKAKKGDIEATLNGRVFMAVPATSLPAPKTPVASAAPQS